MDRNLSGPYRRLAAHRTSRPVHRITLAPSGAWEYRISRRVHLCRVIMRLDPRDESAVQRAPFGGDSDRVRIDWRIAIASAAGLALVFATQNTAVLGFRQSFPTKLAAQSLSWAIWLVLLPLIFAISARAHRRGLRDWRALALQITAGVVVAAMHGILLAITRSVLGFGGSRPLINVVRAQVSLNLPSDLLRYWLIAAVYHAIAYARELRRRDVTQARLAQTLAEARLENLEARLQPHFLFNALNTIAALIRKNPPAAAAMVGQLSELLRAALSAETGRQVTLAAELRLLDQYMAIQRTRFSDRLIFSVHATPEALGAYVPQMILQPIVENAVRHGIGPREGPGTIAVEAARQGGALRLLVRDDGVGYGNASPGLRGNGVGLRATRARLAHLYGDECVFDIRAASPGTIVTIEIPFETDEVRAPRGAA
jgi:two-component system LytT family sensor kinase